MTMTILRTPESRFGSLPDYPFAPHYVDVDGIRIHYVDEGDSERVIFLFHGQPSWSYLYRHMIPPLVAAGYRVIAPDLVGFGKSDKPVDPRAHTYRAHVDWMTGFVRALGVANAAAFLQDWGGLIGLRVLANEPQWLSRLVLANTALPEVGPVGRAMMPLMIKMLGAFGGTPDIEAFEESLSFKHWLTYFKRSKTLEVGRLIQALTTRDLSTMEMSAYDAPFPEPSYYAGPRTMPQIVATDLAEVRRAWKDVLQHWEYPVLTLFSDKDPFLAGRGMDAHFRERFPGAQGQPHHTTQDASHFLQEDQSEDLATRIIEWLHQTGFSAHAHATG